MVLKDHPTLPEPLAPVARRRDPGGAPPHHGRDKRRLLPDPVRLQQDQVPQGHRVRPQPESRNVPNSLLEYPGVVGIEIAAGNHG